MHKKYINHGIRVFALCFTYTGYLPGLEVYLGKSIDTNDNLVFQVVDRMINKADLIYLKGITLYADNWYATARLVKFLYEIYRWLFVDTVVANDSKDGEENSIPFHKL